MPLDDMDSDMMMAYEAYLKNNGTAGNEVVQAMKKHTDSQHIIILRRKEPDVTESC